MGGSFACPFLYLASNVGIAIRPRPMDPLNPLGD